MSKFHDKLAIEDWEQYLKSIQNETTVDTNMTFAERLAKIKKLEDKPEEWMKEMFPNYAKYPFAKFHIKAIIRLVTHDDWYEVLSWARELSKSTVVMMVVIYLVLTGKKKNILLVSNNLDNAVRLLAPYRANLEANERIKFYYGEQVGITWTNNEFITKKGVAFRALGARQSPRGSRNENIRPDTLLLDDFDTDEECRNPDILDAKWKWFEEALYFTRSMSEPLLTIWCGNVIAKDCCIVRAGSKAKELSELEKPLGHWDIINLRMVDINRPNPKDDFRYGTTVWPEKNTEEKIDRVLIQVSASAAQKECFNNPVSEGKYFKNLKWGKIPPLNKFPILISYGDPAPSNKVAKSKNPKKQGSYKANFIIGIYNGVLYIITGYLDHVTQDEFVNWYYYQKDYVKDKTQLCNYVENNKLQDPFYQQVFVPIFDRKAIEKGYRIPIKPDERSKPDKFVRIEGNLEPINRAGKMIFNEAEKDNPHMKRLIEQFELFDDGLPAPADGPDCIEGGYFILQQLLATLSAGSYTVGARFNNKQRF